MNHDVHATPPVAVRRVLGHPHLRFAVLVGTLAWLVDWVSKSWALAELAGRPREVGDALLLGVAHNDALAFSSFQWIPVESVLSLRITCILVLALLAIRFAAESRRLACAFALLLAGGLGNVADLVLRDGAVIDFIGVRPFVFAEPDLAIVFNLADVWIKVGIILAFPLIRRAAQRTQEASDAFERRLQLRLR
ncbi:MAG: signal peptidase II [Candidatus Cloacimonetes bacterium]|jgi:lipoprotein signal peptidase|nr:signal peptidase II [Candidatus Cloacimonadota bacterium]